MKHSSILKKAAVLLLAVILLFSFVTGCSASSVKNPSQNSAAVALGTAAAADQAEQAVPLQSVKKNKTDTSGKNQKSNQREQEDDDPGDDLAVTEDGEYSSKEEVALYLHLYGHLPDNYITKSEAKKLGWVSSEGNLWKVAPGKSIGGDTFGNREGLLPGKKGRKYYECDIDFDGGYRGSDRIIYSNDGLVYFTGDHYQSYELLYGDE